MIEHQAKTLALRIRRKGGDGHQPGLRARLHSVSVSPRIPVMYSRGQGEGVRVVVGISIITTFECPSRGGWGHKAEYNLL